MSQVVLAAAVIGAAYYFSQSSEEAGAASNVSGGGLFSILGNQFDQLQSSILKEGMLRDKLSLDMLKLDTLRGQSFGSLTDQLRQLAEGQNHLSKFLGNLALGNDWVPEIPDMTEIFKRMTEGATSMVPTIPSLPGYAPDPNKKTWAQKANEAGMGLMGIPWEFGKGALWDYPYEQGLKMRKTVNGWINQAKSYSFPSLGSSSGAGKKLASLAAVSSLVGPFSALSMPVSGVVLLSKFLPTSKTQSRQMASDSSMLLDRLKPSYTPTKIRSSGSHSSSSNTSFGALSGSGKRGFTRSRKWRTSSSSGLGRMTRI